MYFLSNRLELFIVKDTDNNGGPRTATDSELVDLDTYLESDHDPGANVKGILKF